MKPNILGLGFYSKEVPQSCLTDLREQVEKRSKFVRVMIRDTTCKSFVVVVVVICLFVCCFSE